MDPNDEEQMEVDGNHAANVDSTSDSDDSEFEEIDVSIENMALITKLETDLEVNPNLYDVHLQYITLLRKCKMRERTRAAREAMHSRFPFSENLWLEWLQDELRQDAEHSRIKVLFEKATHDYLSTKVWAMYIRWAATIAEAQDSSKDSIEQFREIGEKAVTAGGLHLAAGSAIWSAYREHELAILATDPADEKQIQRVRALFQRQLQVPLIGNEDTSKALHEWESQQIKPQELPQHVQKNMEKAQAAVAQRQALEEAVAPCKPANEELLAAYMAYIQLEQEQGQPARVMVLYERAVAMFPVTHLLWQQYAAYLQGSLKVHGVIIKVYERAIRNCPWIGALWACALRALERNAPSDEAHKQQYDSALQAGLQSADDYTQVLLARIDFLRRRGKEAYPQTRDAFRTAKELLASYFPGWVDRSLLFVMYEAQCALRLGDGVSEARTVWNAALRTPLNKFMDVWAAFIAMEVAEQNFDAARSIYKRCYSYKLEGGGQAALCQAWLRFEREHGSADDHLQAVLKTDSILKQATAEAMAAANAEAAAVAQGLQAAAKKAEKLSPEEMKRMRQAKDPHFKKSGAAKQGSDAFMPPPASRMPPKRKKGLGFQESGAKRPRPDGAAAPLEVATEGTAGPAFASLGAQDVNTINTTGQTMQQAPEASAAEAEEKQSAAEASTSGRPFYTDECTAFVRGLQQDVEEGDLESFFADCGDIKAVRITRDPQTGQAKGFGYVDFGSRDSLNGAVAMSGTRFKGKDLFIAVSKPTGRGRGGMRGRGRGDLNRGGQFQGRGNLRGGRGRGGRGRGRDSGDSSWQMGGNRGAPVGEGKGPGHHSVHLDLAGLPKGSAAANADGPEGKKSNSDFRKMFLSGGGL